MKTPSSVSLLLTIFLAAAPTGCEPSDSRTVPLAPEEIQGVWITDDPAYADRKMEILEDGLLFHSAEFTFDPYTIQGVRIEPGYNGATYEIEHSGWESGTLTLSFFLRANDSTLVFRNQPLTVWRRDSAGG